MSRRRSTSGPLSSGSPSAVVALVDLARRTVIEHVQQRGEARDVLGRLRGDVANAGVVTGTAKLAFLKPLTKSSRRLHIDDPARPAETRRPSAESL